MSFLTNLPQHFRYFPSPPRGVWYLGPVPIRAYALCIIVGIVVALLIGDRRWHARGGERGVIYDIALWAVPFGLVGGRLYHLMTDWRTYFGNGGIGLQATLRIWDGGLGIWGAVALGGVGAWIGCRRHRIPLPAFGDAVAPGIVLAQAIGRIGNYFNQELYGRATTLPWGLEIFWRQDAAGARDPHLLDGVSTGELYKIVQPTFAYELLWNLLVFVVVIWADRRFRIGHGRLFALYVAGYCVGRFCIELLRDDAATHIAGIRVNSFTSTFVFIGAVVYVILAPRGREDPATLAQTRQEGGTGAQPALPPEEEVAAVGATSGVGAALTASDDDLADTQTEAQTEAQPCGGAEAEPVGEAQAEAGPVGEAEPLPEAAAFEEPMVAQVEPEAKAEATAVNDETEIEITDDEAPAVVADDVEAQPELEVSDAVQPEPPTQTTTGADGANVADAESAAANESQPEEA